MGSYFTPALEQIGPDLRLEKLDDRDDRDDCRPSALALFFGDGQPRPGRTRLAGIPMASNAVSRASCS
jgi:hypothetical protein